MPIYRIHRLKDSQRQQFRSAPHMSGLSIVKPRDYEQEAAVEAPTLYSAWEELRHTDHPLQVGDILELDGGTLQICKYIGFEEARWFVPETAPHPSPEPVPIPPEVT
jgi:hypothetical protein